MTQCHVLISMMFAVAGGLVTPRAAHGQTPDEVARLGQLNRLRHLPPGLVAAELRAA